MGRNGAGKSTAVAAIAGLLPLDAGRVRAGRRGARGRRGRASPYRPSAARSASCSSSRRCSRTCPCSTTWRSASAPRGLRRHAARERGRPRCSTRRGSPTLAGPAARRAVRRAGGARRARPHARAGSPRCVLLDEPLAAIDAELRPALREAIRAQLDGVRGLRAARHARRAGRGGAGRRGRRGRRRAGGAAGRARRAARRPGRPDRGDSCWTRSPRRLTRSRIPGPHAASPRSADPRGQTGVRRRCVSPGFSGKYSPPFASVTAFSRSCTRPTPAADSTPSWVPKARFGATCETKSMRLGDLQPGRARGRREGVDLARRSGT